MSRQYACMQEGEDLFTKVRTEHLPAGENGILHTVVRTEHIPE